MDSTLNGFCEAWGDWDSTDKDLTFWIGEIADSVREWGGEPDLVDVGLFADAVMLTDADGNYLMMLNGGCASEFDKALRWYGKACGLL